ncbi:hypothetical protein I552_0545 [Mycobacterium xenopi 3993]|nr:hypothetical protein I552_0545 [Mycobacterium xenopi 3993]
MLAFRTPLRLARAAIATASGILMSLLQAISAVPTSKRYVTDRISGRSARNPGRYHRTRALEKPRPRRLACRRRTAGLPTYAKAGTRAWSARKGRCIIAQLGRRDHIDCVRGGPEPTRGESSIARGRAGRPAEVADLRAEAYIDCRCIPSLDSRDFSAIARGLTAIEGLRGGCRRRRGRSELRAPARGRSAWQSERIAHMRSNRSVARWRRHCGLPAGAGKFVRKR